MIVLDREKTLDLVNYVPYSFYVSLFILNNELSIRFDLFHHYAYFTQMDSNFLDHIQRRMVIKLMLSIGSHLRKVPTNGNINIHPSQNLCAYMNAMLG